MTDLKPRQMGGPSAELIALEGRSRLDIREMLEQLPAEQHPDAKRWTLCISSDPYVARRGKTHAMHSATGRPMCSALGSVVVVEEESTTPPVCVRCQVELLLRPRQGGKPGKRMERKRPPRKEPR